MSLRISVFFFFFFGGEVGGWRGERSASSGGDGRGREQGAAWGGEGRRQVDYGRRSRCLETAGTRDARLLGDQRDAMTSAV